MAGKKQFSNGTWQYTFKKTGVLDKPIYLTFNTEAEGDEFAARLETLLDRGIVPAEYRPDLRILTIAQLVREYENEAHPSDKDKGSLNAIVKRRGSTPLLDINSAWVDEWISEMKRIEKLAPASVRSRVGSLARCTDWGMRKGFLAMPDHPLRTLPDGYAQYSASDIAAAGIKREDIERDRRLEPGEEGKILAVIEGGVLARKQRPLPIEYPAAHRTLFKLALESAMRLREMYTLTVDQVDFGKRTIFLDRTKNGDKRQVPMTTVAVAILQDYLAVRELPKGIPADALFPWWNGSLDKRELGLVTDYLSSRFGDIFGQAGCVDLKFHDLRHTAVCHIYERTKLSDIQISRITGHKSLSMLRRYANLRGSDLYAAMW